MATTGTSIGTDNMIDIVVIGAGQAGASLVAKLRNLGHTGGITLIGLHRDGTVPDVFGKTVSFKVRSQKYYIISDEWGQIIDTNLRDLDTAYPIRNSRPTTAGELFDTVSIGQMSYGRSR